LQSDVEEKGIPPASWTLACVLTCSRIAGFAWTPYRKEVVSAVMSREPASAVPMAAPRFRRPRAQLRRKRADAQPGQQQGDRDDPGARGGVDGRHQDGNAGEHGEQPEPHHAAWVGVGEDTWDADRCDQQGDESGRTHAGVQRGQAE
jgi:hypothetical protein